MTDLSKLQYIREYKKWRKEKDCNTCTMIVGTLISFAIFGLAVIVIMMI